MRIAATLVLAVLAPFAICDVINVPADFALIQDAISAAVNGDEVVIAPGTYNEHYITLGGKAITLRSTDPNDMSVVEATIISGFQLGPVLRCVDGEGLDTVIAGLTITNGKATEDSGFNGGGLEITFSSATVENCVFRNNIARNGGGASVYGTAVFRGCIFEENSANLSGGGLYMIDLSSSSVVEQCEFRDNSSPSGGGISCLGVGVALVDCRLANNISGNVGGGINIFECDVSFKGCVFENNIAELGGALFGFRSTLLISRCEFLFNEAGGAGGAIYNSDLNASHPVSIDHCIILGNSAASGFGGGGVYAIHSAVAVSHTTLVSNSTPARGGAFYLSNTTLVVNNSILWDNQGLQSGNMFFAIGGLSSTAAEHSILQEPHPGAGNIVGNPGFVQMPDTGAMDPGDLQLSYTSIAIDAGDNALVPSDVLDLDGDMDTSEPAPFDLAGEDRFIDDPFSTDSGSGAAPIVDIGPYEFVPTLKPCNPADLALPYAILDFTDILAFLTAFASMDPAADLALPDGVFDFTDVIAFLAAFGAGCP